LFWRNIAAQIHDFKSPTFEHRADKVLADIMQVSLDSPMTTRARGFISLAASKGRRISRAPFRVAKGWLRAYIWQLDF